jgi:hypothetical protein
MPHPKKLYAFCWLNGAIDFGHYIPADAIGLAVGEESLVREKIKVTAQQKAGTQLIVPAMGAAYSDNNVGEAFAAAARYIAKLDAVSTVGFKAIGA